MPYTPSIGIIANPESGRDIRRLVAHASVVDNLEKANMVKRIIATVEKLGVEKLVVMPETFGITERALSMLPQKPCIDIEFIDMRVIGDWRDTYYAAKYMDSKVGAIIVIGGDGTNRVVAKADVGTPLMPISTGTNNVFPEMIEATIAAVAAAVIATGVVKKEDATYRAKKIELFVNNELADIALVDAATTIHQFTASRAVWKPEYICEILAAIAAPYNIGLSSIPGIISAVSQKDDHAVYVEITHNNPKKHITAPIAPGLVKKIPIGDARVLKLGEKIELKTRPSVIALDGERELEISKDDILEARVVRKGPLVIDYKKALLLASRNLVENIVASTP